MKGIYPRIIHWGKPILPGTKFGNLTVLGEAEATYWGKYRKRMFLCRCECGKETIVHIHNLRSGHTQSCGCNLKTISAKSRLTHGSTPVRLHSIWNSMLTRCRNPHAKSFKYYGAKGVQVCTEWLTFVLFRSWALANGYRNNLTIDRINPYGNYEPSNCRWIPKNEQGKNRRQ